LDIGVLGYIGIVQHKEHSPEVLSIPPGTPVYKNVEILQKISEYPSKDGKYFFYFLTM